MQVSQIVKKNLEIDSQSFKDLSPLMKEAVSDVFKLIEKETRDIITRFENSVNIRTIRRKINGRYLR